MKKLILAALFLPSLSFADSLYIQAEALHVLGPKMEVYQERNSVDGPIVYGEECQGPYHCYGGHNLLTLESGVNLGQWDFYFRHTSSADAQDNGVNGIGVRFREDLFNW